MKRASVLIRYLILASMVVFLAPRDVVAQISAGSNTGNWFYGSGLGLMFGNVTYIGISPTIGYELTDRFAIGGSMLYRYHTQKTEDQNLTANDFGASLFTTCTIIGPLFVQGEVEALNYTAYRIDLYPDHTEVIKDRPTAISYFVGAGLSQSITHSASIYVVGLYNLSYAGYSQPAPYSSPWILRCGVSFHF